MKKQHFLDKLTDKATYYVGTPASLVVHTIFFVLCFALIFLGVGVSIVLLGLTTLVSLEAIYLSLFIQTTVNRHSRKLTAVHKDISELQDDVDDLQDNDAD